MQVQKKKSHITVEEYLEEEARGSVRNEYVDGQVYAMTGATGKHRRIAKNIFSQLTEHLSGSRCEVDISDAQVYVEVTNSFYYPDLVVSCGEFDQDSMQVADPVLIVEVLSPSTAGIDRREKLFAYKRLPTLKEYMMVHQKRRRVELHRRNENGSWDVFEAKEGAIELESMPCGRLSLPLDLIYERAKFEPDTDWHVSEEIASYTLEGTLDW